MLLLLLLFFLRWSFRFHFFSSLFFLQKKNRTSRPTRSSFWNERIQKEKKREEPAATSWASMNGKCVCVCVCLEWVSGCLGHGPIIASGWSGFLCNARLLPFAAGVPRRRRMGADNESRAEYKTKQNKTNQPTDQPQPEPEPNQIRARPITREPMKGTTTTTTTTMLSSVGSGRSALAIWFLIVSPFDEANSTRLDFHWIPIKV